MGNSMRALEQMGMDPRVFNDASLRASLIPAVNTQWTARGLASMYGALAADGCLLGHCQILSQAYCRRLHAEISSAPGPGLWPSGFRRMKVAASTNDARLVFRGFG